jgi:hypothetical protein
LVPVVAARALIGPPDDSGVNDLMHAAGRRQHYSVAGLDTSTGHTGYFGQWTEPSAPLIIVGMSCHSAKTQ